MQPYSRQKKLLVGVRFRSSGWEFGQRCWANPKNGRREHGRSGALEQSCTVPELHCEVGNGNSGRSGVSASRVEAHPGRRSQCTKKPQLPGCEVHWGSHMSWQHSPMWPSVARPCLARVGFRLTGTLRASLDPSRYSQTLVLCVDAGQDVGWEDTYQGPLEHNPDLAASAPLIRADSIGRRVSIRGHRNAPNSHLWVLWDQWSRISGRQLDQYQGCLR